VVTCVVCDTEFFSARERVVYNTPKYCSKSCKKADVKLKIKKAKEVRYRTRMQHLDLNQVSQMKHDFGERSCKTCGVKFAPCMNSHKYCSNDCRKITAFASDAKRRLDNWLYRRHKRITDRLIDVVLHHLRKSCYTHTTLDPNHQQTFTKLVTSAVYRKPRQWLKNANHHMIKERIASWQPRLFERGAGETIHCIWVNGKLCSAVYNSKRNCYIRLNRRLNNKRSQPWLLAAGANQWSRGSREDWRGTLLDRRYVLPTLPLVFDLWNNKPRYVWERPCVICGELTNVKHRKRSGVTCSAKCEAEHKERKHVEKLKAIREERIKIRALKEMGIL
jgi:hypothetical protein